MKRIGAGVEFALTIVVAVATAAVIGLAHGGAGASPSVIPIGPMPSFATPRPSRSNVIPRSTPSMEIPPAAHGTPGVTPPATDA